MNKHYLSLVLASISTICSAQYLTTFFSETAKKVDDAMVMDKLGNIYGSNYMGSNVYKISPNGTSAVFAGGFNTPNGLAFDSQNNLYVCDMQGGKIFKLSYTGQFLDTVLVPNPSGIIKSIGSDTMIFTQYQSNIINKLAPDGTVFPLYSGAPLNGPVGLAYDSAATLFVANFNNRKLFRVSSSNLTYVATVPGPSSGWLGFITYAKGALWGTSYNSHKIYKINPYYQDSVSLYIGSTVGFADGTITTAKFNSPNGILPSITGDSLYISEMGSGKIRLILPHDLSAIYENYQVQESFAIFPCPVKHLLTIKLNTFIKEVRLYDSVGSLIISSKLSELDVSALPPGVYLVAVSSESEIFYKKIVKI